jgi:hypothetical protein
MGIHTGPVYRVADINANRNVQGGGINTAQRVMDCGDAGHILLSKSSADVLTQVSCWEGTLFDLGFAKVKHGERVHLFNLCVRGLGNRAVPNKLRSQSLTFGFRKIFITVSIGVMTAAILSFALYSHYGRSSVASYGPLVDLRPVNNDSTSNTAIASPNAHKGTTPVDVPHLNIPPIVNGGAAISTKFQNRYLKNNVECAEETVKVSATEWQERNSPDSPTSCDAGAVIFKYTERESNDPQYFLLYDEGRNLFARIPNIPVGQTGPSDWRQLPSQTWNAGRSLTRVN